MNDDYLWDRTGPPDPEIARLERALRPYCARPARPAPPARRAPLALAAALAVAGAAALLSRIERRAAEPAPNAAAVRLAALAGGVATGGRRVGEALRPGDRIDVGAESRAELAIGPIGSIELEAGARLVVGEHQGDASSYRMFLERGTMEATIFAAPRVFQVGTPSGIAVDLGCIYRATVEPDGSTRLAVVFGAVSFEAEGRKVHVPSGAECIATPRGGPGTPAWQDQPLEYKAALARIDAARQSGATAAAAADLERIAGPSATERDTLTLWHLLDAPDAKVRSAALGRIEALVALPSSIDRAALAAGEGAALAALRELLEDAW